MGVKKPCVNDIPATGFRLEVGSEVVIGRPALHREGPLFFRPLDRPHIVNRLYQSCDFCGCRHQVAASSGKLEHFGDGTPIICSVSKSWKPSAEVRGGNRCCPWDKRSGLESLGGDCADCTSRTSPGWYMEALEDQLLKPASRSCPGGIGVEHPSCEAMHLCSGWWWPVQKFARYPPLARASSHSRVINETDKFYPRSEPLHSIFKPERRPVAVDRVK